MTNSANDVGNVHVPYTAGVWSCPITTGERPPPCSHCTFTRVDDSRAVVFGGRKEEWERNNDVYIIDLHAMVMLYSYRWCSIFSKLLACVCSI